VARPQKQASEIYLFLYIIFTYNKLFPTYCSNRITCNIIPKATRLIPNALFLLIEEISPTMIKSMIFLVHVRCKYVS
jgi:hypothetical protein